MKIAALTALGICCALSGQYIAFRLNMRVRMLEKIRMMLSAAGSSMEFLHLSAYEMIRSLSENPELAGLKFLGICRENMESGMNFRDAWSRSLDGNLRYLRQEDRALLVSFGEFFGISDTNGQLANFRLHEMLAEENLAAAREMQRRYASLSCGMGIVCGIGIVIVLF